jgi:tRNA (guanine37-N1)-methyltransferase
MRYYVVTLFPEMVTRFCSEGLLGRAVEAGRIAVECVNPRDFATDRHRSVDDTPYGGGSGMVMRPGPLVDAMEEAERREAMRGASRPWRVLLTPQGKPLTQADARSLAVRPSLCLVCGRYEGIDERARSRVDQEVSLGDFVLMGGEVGAFAVIEATARLLDGVLGNQASVEEESHAQGLLEYPHYTRPPVYRDESVPEVLLSGNHARIAQWRRRQALRRTFERRPDLAAAVALSEGDRALVEDLRETAPHGEEE